MSKQFDKQNIAEERKMMLERIVEIVKEQLNVSDVAITADTSFEKDLDVDSLDLFELVMALEEEYDVEIPSEDLERLTTVGEVIAYLKEKGVEE
jgi:acyl carrier protein